MSQKLSSLFAFDLWGDAVNVVARMEPNSEPGKINISNSTAHLLGALAQLAPRGNIRVKGKEDMSMFFAEVNLDS